MLVVYIALGILLALGILRILSVVAEGSVRKFLTDDEPKVSKWVWIALALTPVICVGFMLIH